jgi:hypothetical protein
LASTVCAVSIGAKPGNYTATIVTYDAVSCTTSCTIPPGAKPLSLAESLAFAVTRGAANSIALTLSGIPAKVKVLPLTASSVINASQGIDLLGIGARKFVINAYDPDGNLIVGPGSPTYTVSQSGALGITVTPPTTGAPNTFSITPPAVYSASSATLTITATAGNLACTSSFAACTTNVTVNMKELLAVADNNSTIDIFEVGSTTPYATLSFGIAFGFFPGIGRSQYSIAFDHSGNLLVANCLQGCGASGPDSVAVFAPPYNGTPQFISNGIVAPSALMVTPSGNLFVANCASCSLGGADTVTQYAPPFTSSSAPISTTANGIAVPASLALDSTGVLWVGNCATCHGGTSDSVTSYASPYSGAASHTLFQNISSPQSIALDASNNLFVLNSNQPNVIFFAAPLYLDPVTPAPPTITSIGTVYNGATGNLSAPFSTLVSGSDVLIADNGSGTGAVLRCGPVFQTASPNCGSDILTITSGVNNPQAMALDGSADLFAANCQTCGGPGPNTVAEIIPPTYTTNSTFTLSNGSGPFALSVLP